MDPLSEVINLVEVRSSSFARFEGSAPWAYDFPGLGTFKFGVVLRGSCFIRVDGGEPVRLVEGDCYLLGNSRLFWFGSAPDVPARPAAEVFANMIRRTARWGTGEDVEIVGCRHTFDEIDAKALLDLVPPLIHVPAATRHAEALRAAVRLLEDETAEPAFGAELVIERLLHIAFVQLLRAHAAAVDGPTGTWLCALGHPQIGAALALMHEQPARRWTLTELATKVGMSRSSFAAQFSELVGTPPGEYLLAWRMRNARRELRTSDRTVAAIAAAYGYGSESAFSNAFKRFTGSSPSQYRAR